MSSVDVLLFGHPRLEKNGQVISLGRSRALALLAYLCRRPGPHSRDELVGLLWPSFDAQAARNNLRRELSHLRAALPEGVLLADRLSVEMEPAAFDDGRLTLDAAAFEAGLERRAGHDHSTEPPCDSCAGALESAIGYYRADFLDGFALPDSPAFDEWQFHEAETLRAGLRVALAQLSRWYDARGDPETALKYARRWAVMDPLDEEAQRVAMSLYEAGGHHAAAIRHFEVTRQGLRDELGVEPEPATLELAAAIRERRFTRDTPPAVAKRESAPPVHLPAETTPFIGRDAELARLEALLAEPDARFITIQGAGGMGKTRLALAAARRLSESPQAAAYPEGIYFVSLAAVNRPADIVPTLAQHIGFTLGGDASPVRQLSKYLRARRLLLLLDNLEQLATPECVHIFSELLSDASGIKLLATSRVRLGLRGEQLFPINGLDLPAAGSDGDTLGPAVALFIARARRSNPSLLTDESNLEAIVSICRLVEGMPLGIELAAGWSGLLTPTAIQDEIERNIDFLKSADSDTPPRQTSLRAVFDSSWQLLTAEERSVLGRLTIFPSSFDRDAAAVVGRAALPSLLSLINKSWLQPVGDNRFRIHELLCQYASECREDDPEVLLEHHALHFADYVASLMDGLRSPQPERAYDLLAADLDNIRAAMDWLITHDRIEILTAKMAAPLFRYLESHYYYFLFEAMIDEAINRAEALNLTRETAILLTFRGGFFFQSFPTRFLDYHWIGSGWSQWGKRAMALMEASDAAPDMWNVILSWLYGRFVDAAEAVATLQNLIAEFVADGARWEEAFARQSLGRLLAARPRWSGDAPSIGEDHVRRMLQIAQGIFETLGDEREAAITMLFRGFERQSGGDLVTAKTLLLQTQERLRGLGESIIAANINWQLGEIHMQLGELETSLAYFHEMSEIFLRKGHPNVAVAGLSRESYEAVRYGDLDSALRLREHCLALSHQTGERFSESWDYWEMGEIYRVMDRPDDARHWFERARVSFDEIEVDVGLTFYYRGLGDIALAGGDAAAAVKNFQLSCHWAEETEHSWQFAYALTGLGRAATALGDDAARDYLAQALRRGWETGDGGGLPLYTMMAVAEVEAKRGERERAEQLARVVLAHRLSWRETRLAAAALLGIEPAEALNRDEATLFDLKPLVDELIELLNADRPAIT